MRHEIVLMLCSLAIGHSNAGQAGSAPARLTESQAILAKVMDDIRRCDKTVHYEYDSKSRRLSPPEINKIKGLKLKRLHREIAVFEINETYEGLRAAMLLVGRPNTGHKWPMHSVAFRDSYQAVRQRLERQWHLQLEDGLRPDPDVILDGLYADVSMIVDGTTRRLSIEKMPLDVYPHIGRPDVGCNDVRN